MDASVTEGDTNGSADASWVHDSVMQGAATGGLA